MVNLKKTSKYGRGLYASKDIKKGQIVEISPAIVLDKYDANIILPTVINTYVFEWCGNSAIALGYGSLFNHSKQYNVSYSNNFIKKEIVFVANKNIKKGRQLFINYGYDPKRGLEVTKRNKEKAMAKVEIYPILSPSREAQPVLESK